MEKNEAQKWADDLNEKEKTAFRRMCIMISNYDDLCQELLNENEKLRNFSNSEKASRPII